MSGEALKARVWIECASTAELAAFLEHLRAEFGYRYVEPDPGRRFYIATYAVESGEWKAALWDAEHRARDLLRGFDGLARLVRVDLFEPDAPHLHVLNVQVAGVKEAA